MRWIELSARTDAEGAEAAAALLNELTPGGAVIEQTVTPEAAEEFDPARAFTVRAFFNVSDRALITRAETALWHLSQLRAMAPRTREIKNEDWAEAWKKHYAILPIGTRLVIKPSWLAYAPRAGEVVVELDPGMAFGTGLHPTTRMCLQAVEARARPVMHVLDVGTGSGILSIAAAKLGAASILALDTDPIAVQAARKNAEINRIASVMRVERGSIDAARDRAGYDLVCANILAEVVTELAPALAASLRATGCVIASGILDYKADGVADALERAGLAVVEKMVEEDWVTLAGTRRPSTALPYGSAQDAS